MGDRVADWLSGHVRNRVLLSLLGGVLAICGGALILAATWGVVYVVCLFSLGWWLGFQHWFYVVAAFVFIPLLFWGNARTPREYLQEIKVSTGTGSDKVVTFYLPGVGMVSNIDPLAPDTMHTGIKLITASLYTGPRVVTAGIRTLGRVLRLRRLDVQGCAAVLTLLDDANRKISFQEIADSISGLDPVRIFPQLRDIGGVQFLQKEPSGLVLSPSLKERLRAAS